MITLFEELREKDKKKKDIVSIHNLLINAAQNLSLSEKRILMMAIAQNTEKRIKKNECLQVEIKADDFSRIFKIKRNTAYETIKNATDTMIKKQITWTGRKETIKTNWLADAEYQSGKGSIKISFTPKIQLFLLELRKNFTTYNLERIREINSIHSWRLFEILSQFKNTGWRKISIDNFNLAMEATQNQKKDFSKVRTQLIEPAIKELNFKLKLHITWKTIKERNRVIAVCFYFK